MTLTIIVEDRVFQVNAEKYARESEFIRALLEGSYIESTQRSVTLHDVSLEDWNVFFDFIEGRESLSTNNGETVLYIADRFGFDRARSQVEALLLHEKMLTQISDWEVFAIQILHLINRFKDRRSRMIRERLISTLEKHHVNVGLSIQKGRVMYQQP
ncbi:hypothetical protein PRIPAC_95689 [Pristionchus pacificus]|nr:hypothetical protein PRIPAC_95689 [Pristionchus pacificus]